MRLGDLDELIRKGTSTFDESIPIADFIDLVDSMPTIDAEPIRHGHWKYRGGNLYECSVCHTGLADDDDILCGVNNYCSYCGAKMDDTAPSEEEYDEYYAKHRD